MWGCVTYQNQKPHVIYDMPIVVVTAFTLKAIMFVVNTKSLLTWKPNRPFVMTIKS